MGWDFCNAWQSREDVKAALTQSYEASGCKVLASGFTREHGICLWFALDVSGARWEDGPTCDRMITMAIVAREGRSYGFKEMSESMGPCFYGVPLDVWAAVKDHAPPGGFAKEWRAVVKPGSAPKVKA